MSSEPKVGGPRESAETYPVTATPAGWLDPTRDEVLIRYRESVRQWHGFIRFLGLPHLRDNPDVPIDRLFIEPRLAGRHVPADEPPEKWPATQSVLETLSRGTWTLVLGDPGCGKSTLASWLAWQFARIDRSPWVERFGRFVPIPLVLRELRLAPDLTWEGLLASFLEHEVARPLRGTDRLEQLVASGQAYFLVDGLDELANLETRRALQRVIRQARQECPGCRWLLTSRIVGYAECPFLESDEATLPVTPDLPEDPGLVWREFLPRGESEGLCYIAPFSDEQIERFAMRWFVQREAVAEVALQRGRNLLDAIGKDGATRKLARIPNLLVLMALIHRVRARLPHGRALLYGEIVTAYLESIDEFRGLLKPDYPLAQKRRWLARVGFEMQVRRSAAADVQAKAEDRPILATGAEVRGWIAEAMGESGFGQDKAAAADFVDYVGRRSGLLLPRGQDRFAFMHLSFQEFFAATYLSEHVTGPRWYENRDQETAHGAPALRRYAEDPAWREAMVLLFEVLADRTGWPETLHDVVFGGTPDSEGLLRLLAEVAVDPYSGLPEGVREKAFRRCLRHLVQGDYFSAFNEYGGFSDLCRIVFSAEENFHPIAWKALLAELQAHKVRRVSLLMTGIRNLAPLQGLPIDSLELAVYETDDIKELCRFDNLRSLGLYFSGREPLEMPYLPRNLDELHVTSVFGALSVVADWEHAAAVTHLTFFDPVSSLHGIQAFRSLRDLRFWCDRVPDLDPLVQLSTLRRLVVHGETTAERLASFRAARPDVEIVP